MSTGVNCRTCGASRRMHEALLGEVGLDGVAFLRLRRARLQTLESQIRTNVQFRLKNYPGALLACSNTTWESLSYGQQLLWNIDELEARWQRLLRRFPSAHALEINWDGYVSNSTLLAVADALRCPRANFQHLHRHSRKRMDFGALRALDLDYRAKMNYTDEQRWEIRLARF
mmetsp:Transcript_15931/g.32021  ORF Transcript_15931/g.32021 Transcript_15931/m.32021 type:complete len:172 (-) Transcript_15931:789-1304(-)